MEENTLNHGSPARLGIGEGTKHTLLELLEHLMIRSPEVRDPRTASSTTSRAARVFKSESMDGDELETLIYCPDLLDSSLELASKMAQAVTLDEANCFDTVFIGMISPLFSTSFCSPVLNSEYDSREYASAGLIRPAIAAMHLLSKGGVPLGFDGSKSDGGPYACSGFTQKGKKGAIADGVLMEGPYKKQREKKDEKTLLAMEMKSSNALTERTFGEFTRIRDEEGFQNSLALRFIWPEKDTVGISKSTKIIAQAWIIHLPALYDI